MNAHDFWPHFHEVFEDSPRQGPGERESTERALRSLPPLEAQHRVLDIGCGSGTQTIDLALLTKAQITAVDLHPPFIKQLAAKIESRGLQDRVEAQVGDMMDLPFPNASFDVVWSEGAIFIMGFAQGLSNWKRLLRPGGYLVVSEFCWLKENPAPELLEVYLDGCPEAGGVDARLKDVSASGYRLFDHFVLPERAWWENFYVPLGASLDRFRGRHAGDSQALAAATQIQREIELYQQHVGAFGYVFFVMQPNEGA